MANWIGVITNGGNDLLNEWVSERALRFDSAAAGSGTVAVAGMMAQTALADQKQEASIIGADKVDGGVRLKLRISAHETGYTLNQYGVWASLTGGDSILIALFQHEQGIQIPSKSESPDFVYTFYALIGCSNTGTWTVNIDTSAVVSGAEMDRAIAEATNGMQTKITASGLLKGDGKGNVTQAVAGTDYAAAKHASQHASGGSDPITPASIGAMPSMKRTFIYDGINSNKKLTTAGWYRILKHNSPDDKAFLINIGHQYSDTGPENVLFFVCSVLSCPSIVVLSHSNNPSRPTIIFYKKIRITKDSDYTYIDFYRAQDGDECIPRVSIIEFITDATLQANKSEPLDVLPVDEAPDGEKTLLTQDVSVIPSGNVLTDANKAKSVAVTLTASAWDSSAKTQTVTVSGVLADETKQLITPAPALASQAAYYDAVILCTGQAANKLTFTAKKVPTDDLTVYVTIQEVGS